jgi:hypothetical protein
MMSGTQRQDFARFSLGGGPCRREGLMQSDILYLGEPTEIVPACR